MYPGLAGSVSGYGDIYIIIARHCGPSLFQRAPGVAHAYPAVLWGK